MNNEQNLNFTQYHKLYTLSKNVLHIKTEQSSKNLVRGFSQEKFEYLNKIVYAFPEIIVYGRIVFVIEERVRKVYNLDRSPGYFVSGIAQLV